MFKKERNIILLAILIRLLVAPFFYHPDIKSQLFHTQYFSHGVLNIYDFVDKNKSNLPYPNIFVYLPFTYYFFGIIDSVLSYIYPSDLYTWLNDWGVNQNNYPNMMFFMLVLKLPYLFFDLLIGFLLYKIYNKKILYFWLFNPISIYLIYILGNFDVVPVFLTVLSFYLLKKNRPTLSHLSIGFAIALKIYPLMFLPFLVFYDPKNIIKNFKYILLSFFPLFLSLVPFLQQSSFYSSFLGSGLTQKILEYKVLNIPVFPVLYFLILINYVFSKYKFKFELVMLQTFLVFIGLVKFHPQWILWFFPFLIIFYYQFERFKYFFYVFFALIFSYILLFNDNFLFWGHLIPINGNFAGLTSPYQLIKLRLNLDPALIQQNIHYLLLAIGIIFSFLYAKKK